VCVCVELEYLLFLTCPLKQFSSDKHYGKNGGFIPRPGESNPRARAPVRIRAATTRLLRCLCRIWTRTVFILFYGTLLLTEHIQFRQTGTGYSGKTVLELTIRCAQGLIEGGERGKRSRAVPWFDWWRWFARGARGTPEGRKSTAAELRDRGRRRRPWRRLAGAPAPGTVEEDGGGAVVLFPVAS
jgi:hypothetical protein